MGMIWRSGFNAFGVRGLFCGSTPDNSVPSPLLCCAAEPMHVQRSHTATAPLAANALPLPSAASFYARRSFVALLFLADTYNKQQSSKCGVGNTGSSSSLEELCYQMVLTNLSGAAARADRTDQTGGGRTASAGRVDVKVEFIAK